MNPLENAKRILADENSNAADWANALKELVEYYDPPEIEKFEEEIDQLDIERDIKQVIIIRKDLNMRKGKMIAQGAHASLSIFLNKIHDTFDLKLMMEDCIANDGYEDAEVNMVIEYVTAPMLQWILENQKKIVVGVESEKELLAIYKKASDNDLPTVLIKDQGLTEFKKPTHTAVAIGPALSEQIDEITGHLELL